MDQSDKTESVFPLNNGEDTPMPLHHFGVDQELELHIFHEKDAATLFAITDQNRTYLRPWLSWVDRTQGVEDSLAFIRDNLLRYAENRGFSCGIWYLGQLVGTIGYHDIDWSDRKVEIGYWLIEAMQGKGIMTRVCRSMVLYAFETLRLNKIEIHCATGNTRSCAIPQRLGFTLEGVIRQGEWLYDHFVDLNVYGILASEWSYR